MSDSGNIVDFSINSAGVFNVAPGGACLFPLRIEGVIAASSIVQGPANGVLRQLNESTFEYTANPGYAGPDTFSVQVTGKGADGFRDVDHHPGCNGSIAIALIQALTPVMIRSPTGKRIVVASRRG